MAKITVKFQEVLTVYVDRVVTYDSADIDFDFKSDSPFEFLGISKASCETTVGDFTFNKGDAMESTFAGMTAEMDSERCNVTEITIESEGAEPIRASNHFDTLTSEQLGAIDQARRGVLEREALAVACAPAASAKRAALRV